MQNPYVGPRTFTEQEADRFFGRELEARDLLALVISERLVLFYAQSGAGKSSLINTRLIPGLRDRGFEVLPVGRVSGELPPGIEAEAVDNIFTFNLIQSLTQAMVDPEGKLDRSPSGLAGITLADFLQGDANTEADPPDQGYDLLPHVLIIDQLEEIVTTHLDRWQDRGGFFEQLAQAMERHPNLWVVLTMREDFVASLDPYTQFLPNRLRTRFYMQRMSYRAALEAVTRPAELGRRPFMPGVAESLVDNLRKIRIHGHDGIQLGQFIEPVQLQVVCYQLWENLKERPEARITHQDLAEMGDVDKALAQFYELIIAQAAGKANVSEIDLRDWFENQLITEAGTRGLVYRGQTHTGTLPNTAIDELVILLREEVKAGGIWYELVHDSLITPIQQANQAWRLRQPLLQVARNWEQAGKPGSSLLEGQSLKEALDSNWQGLGPLVAEYLEASQRLQQAKDEAARQESDRRRRILTIIAVGVIVAMIVLTISSVWNALRATVSAEEAQAQAETAATAQVEAQVAATAALSERDRAATAEAAALVAKETAEAASTAALVQEAIALAAKETAEAQSTNAEISRAALASRLEAELQTPTPTISPTPTKAPPAVTITEPAGGGIFFAPATISIAAEASSADSSIQKVEFFAGPVSIGEATDEPYRIIWDNVPTGTYTIIARVTDATGLAADSAAVGIIVNSPEEKASAAISIVEPLDGTAFESAPSISIAAEADDPDASIVEVQFFAGTTLLGAQNFVNRAGRYVYTWINAPSDEHTLTAVAIDKDGNTVESEPITITVQFATPTPTITPSPTPNREATASANVILTELTQVRATQTAAALPGSPPERLIVASNHSSRHVDLYRIDGDGSNIRQLTFDFGVEASYAALAGKVAFSKPRLGGIVSLYVMDPDGQNQRPIDRQFWDNWEPSLSPDGTRVVFVSSRDNRGWELYTMTDDPGNPERDVKLLTCPALDGEWGKWAPAWSPVPGNERIIFTVQYNGSSIEGESDIWAIDADGSNCQQLTDWEGREMRPAWSPDGRQIVFTSNHTGNFELYIMEADGRNARRVTTSPIDEDYPAWSNDGQWLAFSRELPKPGGPGVKNIFVMTITGDHLTNITELEVEYWSPVWIP